MVEGAQWRFERQREQAAWIVAWLLRPYQSPHATPLQPRDLLHPPAAVTEEDLDAIMTKQQALRAAGQLQD
jgi:hypothetical protein